MSRCGKTHLLEGAVHDGLRDEALRAHAERCPRCRHELNWLLTEQKLFRARAARDEVQALWGDVARRTGASRRPSVSRALVGVAAAFLLLAGGGRALLALPGSSSGHDASVASVAGEAFEALMTENAISQERAELCSRAEQGIGFHCGYVLASR